jgi:hypothetical protein
VDQLRLLGQLIRLGLVHLWHQFDQQSQLIRLELVVPLLQLRQPGQLIQLDLENLLHLPDLLIRFGLADQ